MGYYSNFRIIQASDRANYEIKIKSDYFWSDDSLLGVKWYECFEDCEDVSFYYPDEVIILEILGEDDTEPRRHYFKAGVHKEGKTVITFEEPSFG